MSKAGAPNVRALRPATIEHDAAAGCAPLAELNAYIRQVTAARRGTTEGEAASAPQELASVQRFRQAWDRGRTQDRLVQALARKPENAGPLNSHALVLRSLALANELSPDYLRRFMAVCETLQWLEAARDALPRVASAGAPTPASSKPARRPAKAKAPRPPTAPS